MTGGEPAINRMKQTTTVRIKLIIWFFVSAEKKLPTAKNAPAVNIEAKYPSVITPRSGSPRYITVKTIGNVAIKANTIKDHEAKNLAKNGLSNGNWHGK